jgi:hypothetical protein
VAVLALVIVGAVVVKAVASDGRAQAVSATAVPVQSGPVLPASTQVAAPANLNTLTLVADGPIESVRAAGVQRVDLAGARATLVVSAWSGPLAIEVALANGQRARVIAEADGARELRLTPAKTVATASPQGTKGIRAPQPKASAKPASTDGTKPELHPSPYPN